MGEEALDDGVRRFACRACGLCCNRGPEMELNEATDLADVFVTRVLFKVHSLPLNAHSRRAGHRSERLRSRLPPAEALMEERRQISQLAVRETIDKAKGRSLHLTISALTVDREKGRCPALLGTMCSIYAARPYACRTVPLHYSRPASVLAGYLDSFVHTPGYACDVSANAPIILEGRAVVAPSVEAARAEAMALAQSERGWKTALAARMDDPAAAARAGLPTFDAVVRHTDAGYATVAPMLVAWRVAKDLGVLTNARFKAVCQSQIALIKAELDRGPTPEAASDLLGLLSEYERETTAALTLATSPGRTPPLARS